MIKAKVVEDIKANRLLCLSKKTGEQMGLRHALDGERPDFYSTKDLAKDTEVSVNITNKKVWKVEVAEDVGIGRLLVPLDGGLAKEHDGERVTVGYTLSSAKKGETVRFVNQLKVFELEPKPEPEK